MKASVLKTEQRTETAWNRRYNIIAYGKYNDQPQRWMEIIAASGTASTCVKRYGKFINGRGLADTALYKLVVNSDGMTADKMLRQHAADLARFSGFCIQFNYQMGTKVEINYVPFENVRMFFDPVKKVVTKFAIHPDWGQRNTAVVKFEEVRIQYLYPYNPDPKVISEQVMDAGGWDKYNGQLMYCSMAGDFVYPAPIYDPVVSDMSTEDAIASVKNRNSRNNFLPAGMLVVKKGKDSGDTETTRDSDDFDENFKSFQGAENACKIIKVEAQFDEERPEFVPFDTKNYDKEFDYSEKSVQENIGKVFMQPAVLRGEMIAGKLGTSTEIKDATDFYNAITEPERIYIEESYAAAFDGFAGRTAEMDYTILPIEYKISDQNAISNPE